MSGLRILLVAALLLGAGCAGTVREFFDDTYLEQDRIYRNRPLGFALVYRGNWTLALSPQQMSRAGRKAARALAQAGQELLYTGATFEGTQGTRAIVCNCNMSNEEFLEQIRSANSASIEKEFGTIDFATETTMFIKWEYQFSGLHFMEFLFRNGTYNIRIAFWTRPELYERFATEYEQIIESLVFTGRF